MALLVLLALLTVPAGGEDPPQAKPPQQEQAQKEQQQAEPPEEDEAFKEKVYEFNPLQAEKEFKVGEFYWKRGNFKGAAARYEEAVRWNPSYAEAFLRWGEALLKLDKRAEAKTAFEQFLEVAPDHKKAREVKKRLDRIKT